MRQFLFCVLAFSYLAQVALAGEPGASETPQAGSPTQLGLEEKHAIFGAGLAVTGLVVTLGTYFGTLENRCPKIDFGGAAVYTAPLYCCNVSGTSVANCSSAFDYSCPGGLTPTCLEYESAQPSSPAHYRAAKKHPSEAPEVKLGFALGGMALVAGTSWFAGAMASLICCNCREVEAAQ